MVKTKKGAKRREEKRRKDEKEKRKKKEESRRTIWADNAATLGLVSIAKLIVEQNTFFRVQTP